MNLLKANIQPNTWKNGKRDGQLARCKLGFSSLFLALVTPLDTVDFVVAFVLWAAPGEKHLSVSIASHL